MERVGLIDVLSKESIWSCFKLIWEGAGLNIAQYSNLYEEFQSRSSVVLSNIPINKLFYALFDFSFVINCKLGNFCLWSHSLLIFFT